MKLDRYNAKRDFDLTDEPSGNVHRTRSGRAFVIQKHDATRLHYDFRLELDGVLLSWAVPKGPSLSPKEKRLAVQVEDHPVDYRDFEGVIPHGEYGGGPVIVWDRGEWAPIGDARAGLKKGRLDFVLEGEKLHGAFVLVRLHGREQNKKNWLLIKRSDAFAREGDAAEISKKKPKSVISGRTVEEVDAGKQPKHHKRVKLPAAGTIAPQLATLVDDVPTGDAWIYELKYDGYRAVATVHDGEVVISTRSGKDWTDVFPTVAKALAKVRARSAVFDGEIAYVMDDGRTDFQSLQNALSGEGDRSRLVYFVFDMLHFDGEDLTGLPLLERKEKLRGVLAGEKPPLKMSDHVAGPGTGEAFFAEASKLGLEGIIAKRGDRPYVSGRGKDWVKVKTQKRQELVIVGFTPPKGTRAGVGALLLGVHDGAGPASKKLRYAGKVGTGFTQASLIDLAKRLGKLVVDEPPVEGAPKMKEATWVRPELVCQVRFTEWTREGALRHPAFEGLREDKKPSQVKRERESPTPSASSTRRRK